MNKLAAILFCALALLLAGGAIGYRMGRGDAPRPENISAAPEVRLPEGNVIAAREPDTAPPPAPQKLPAKAVEMRRLSTTVKPQAEECPPVTVNTSLVRDEQGGIRAVMDSPDGEVIAAHDVPIRPFALPAPLHKWAAGVAIDPFTRRYGAWVDRDVGRLRLGVQVNQGADAQPEVWARLGFTF